MSGIIIGTCSCFISWLGSSLTFSFLQAQRDQLGCDALCYGVMQSTRSGLSVIGTFLTGRLSDRVGRIRMLLLGNIALFVSYVINISANSVVWLWVAMIPTSLFNQNFAVMKALFADYSADGGYTDAERTSAIGKLGMSAGLSLMIGPALGTFCFENYNTAAYGAISLTLISSLLLYFLPNPFNSKAEEQKSKKGPDTLPISPVEAIKLQFMQFFHVPALYSLGSQLLLLIRFCMSLAFNIFMVVWTVSLKSRFGFGPREHAYFMGWIGFWYVISQGFLAKWCIAAAGADHTWVLQLCVICLSFGRLIAMMTNSLSIVYLVMALVIVALGIMNTAISSACSRLAGKDQVGGLYGVFEATENIGGIVGPIIGGLLHRWYELAPITAVIVIYGIVFFSITRFYAKLILRSDSPEHDSIHDLLAKDKTE